jgi:hypothetical protein
LENFEVRWRPNLAILLPPPLVVHLIIVIGGSIRDWSRLLDKINISYLHSDLMRLMAQTLPWDENFEVTYTWTPYYWLTCDESLLKAFLGVMYFSFVSVICHKV